MNAALTARQFLRRLLPHPHSVLLVPIVLPGDLVPPRSRSLVGAAIPHHVTILYPFVAATALDGAVLARVERIARDHRAFRFRLSGIARFPDATYLTVDPQQPFLELIRACESAWPGHPRYGGRFAVPIPHVTIAERPSAPALEAHLAPRLPVEVEAAHLEIWRSELLRGWRCHWRAPLGSEVRPIQEPRG